MRCGKFVDERWGMGDERCGLALTKIQYSRKPD